MWVFFDTVQVELIDKKVCFVVIKVITRSSDSLRPPPSSENGSIQSHGYHLEATWRNSYRQFVAYSGETYQNGREEMPSVCPSTHTHTQTQISSLSLSPSLDQGEARTLNKYVPVLK